MRAIGSTLEAREEPRPALRDAMVALAPRARHARLPAPRADLSPAPPPAPAAPSRRRPAGPVTSLSSLPAIRVPPPRREIPVGPPRSQGSNGLFANKAMTCVVIGTHDENIQAELQHLRQNLADYLMNSGM